MIRKLSVWSWSVRCIEGQIGMWLTELLSEKDLALQKALNIAISKEAAAQGASEIQQQSQENATN